MRKLVLIAATFLVIAAGPALASIPSEGILAEQSVGQPVFDRNGFHVGTIAGYGMSGGTPAALVRPDGSREVVAISFQDIGPDFKGGWRTALNASNVYEQWAWYPGTMDPAG